MTCSIVSSVSVIRRFARGARPAVVASLFLALGALSAHAGLVNTVTVTTPDGAMIDGSVSVGEYAGSVSGGGAGFGGPVGNATMSVDADLNNIYLSLSGLGDYDGNSIRVYFDTRTGGATELSDAAGYNDFADFGRERLSRPASNGLTLPFAADFGLIISPAFGGFSALFELTTGGNNSLVFQPSTGSAVGENNPNSTFEIQIPFSSLGGISTGSVVDFVLIYANNDGQDSAFMSNEGFPFQGNVNNFGNGPASIADFHRLATAAIPESATVAGLGMILLGGTFAIHNRRRRPAA